MASNAELQRKLSQGVEAAKSGDRATARRLLEEVVEQDDRNELAWIWLATVATGAPERREYLRKVLSINPRNQRAREALAQLGDDPVPSAPSGLGSRASTLSSSAANPIRRDTFTPSGRGNIGIIFIIAAVALLLAGIGIIIFGSGALSPEPIIVTATVIRQGLLEEQPTEEPSLTPTPAPSNTPIPPELVTRTAPTLPATLTPTVTASPTVTPAVTSVLELNAFEVYYVSQDPGVVEPALMSIQADGINVGLLENRMRDVEFATDGFTFTFVRDIVDEEAGTRTPEIFITTLENPMIVRQITQLGAEDTSNPSFSPDAQYIVFSSSNGRSAPDLWIVPVSGGNPVALTDTPEGEREPVWSPAGGQIAFTSDQQVAGSSEIFLIDVSETGEPLGAPYQATDSNRNSYSPAWSADGRQIVFASDRTGDSDIYTMDSQGNNEQLVTLADGTAEDFHPGFSPDGRWIVFVSNREDDRFQTYLVRPDGSNLHRLTNDPFEARAAGFRPRKIGE